MRGALKPAAGLLLSVVLVQLMFIMFYYNIGLTTMVTQLGSAQNEAIKNVSDLHKMSERAGKSPKQLGSSQQSFNDTDSNKTLACFEHKVEVLALDVGVGEWDWISNSICSGKCTFTPCCRGRPHGKEEYICSADDVRRAQAVTVHLEWYGVWLKSQKKCGRPCCQRWAELGLYSQSQELIGVQNEPSAWGFNNDSQVLSTLTHFATFRPAGSLPLNLTRKPFVVQYEFAEPQALFDGDLLSQRGGAANHPLVAKWIAKSPGPSSRTAVSYIQNTCKDIFYALRLRGVVFDSYGACENNRDPGMRLTTLNQWDDQMYFKKLALISQHMFDLASENWEPRELWWNTERVYHALLVHTIPIYMGPATVFRRIPHPESIIYVNNFRNYDALAEYILNVSKNESLRARHLAWTKMPRHMWQNGFPDRQFNLSRLSGAMCQMCENIHSVRLSQCLKLNSGS